MGIMNQPRTEVQLPVAYEALRRWADGLDTDNPVGARVGGSDGHFVEYGVVEVHGGVEVTFYDGDTPLHTIVFYGEPSGADELLEELIQTPRLYCEEAGCSNVVKLLTPREQELYAEHPEGFVVYCRDHAAPDNLREPREGR